MTTVNYYTDVSYYKADELLPANTSKGLPVVRFTAGGEEFFLGLWETPTEFGTDGVWPMQFFGIVHETSDKKNIVVHTSYIWRNNPKTDRDEGLLEIGKYEDPEELMKLMLYRFNLSLTNYLSKVLGQKELTMFEIVLTMLEERMVVTPKNTLEAL